MKKEIQVALIIRRLTAAISCLSTVFFAFPALLHAAAGGSVAWQYWHNDSANQLAVASALDSQGNIIITGTSNKNGTDDFYTIKIKADHSGILWSSTFDLAGGSDQAVAVAVDSDDNVIVTGVGNRSGVKKEMVTIKYCGKDVGTPSGYDPPIPGTPYPGLCTAGQIIWTATYDGPARGNDYPTSLAVDADKNIYVGGYGQSLNGGDDDFILLKYAPAGPSADGSPTWQRSFGGNRLDNDYITDVATCSIPNSGQYFVAVTGHILNTSNSYIHTIKYTSAGTRLWEKTFTDKAKVNEVDPKIAMDSSCNVVVAGSVVGSGSNDIYAIKYAAGNGDRLWADGPYTFAGSGDDQLNDIYIDTNNDVFLAGMTYVNLEDDNFYMARLNGGNGHFIWEQDYDSGYWDSALSVAVDNATNSVYVLGVTLENNNDYDFRTIKYRLADGNLLWNSSFDSAIAAGGNQNDWPIGIHLNKAGEVLVTGYIDAVLTGISFDYYAINYVPGLLDPPTGLIASVIASASGIKAALSWTDNSGNETGFEIHRSTKSFEIGNDTLIFTTAADVTAYNDSSALPNTRYYYRVRAKEVVGQVTNLSHSSNQVTTLTTILEYNAPSWLFTKDGKGNGNDEAYGIAVGPDLNPVVTGAGVNSMHYTNFLTMKLDRSNDSRILWEDYNNEAGADLDIAYDIAIAADNSILITGTTNLFSITSKSFDIKTLELAASGTNDGDPRWENSFDNNPPHGLDSGTLAAYNSAGNTWAMAGFGDGGGSKGTDIFIAAFDRNGNPLWPDEIKTYSSNGNDYPTGMIFDGNGDLILTGICNGSGDTNSGAFDIRLMKFNGSTGVSIWNDTYNHQGGDDRSVAITVDDNNDVYLTGYVTNDSSKNIYTAKYAGLTGERLWHQTYNGPANGDDTAEAIAYDKIWNGEIIVGGTRLSSANNHDFYIVRYDPVDGAIKREITLDREFDDDHLKVMGTDLSGSMCVVGATGSSSGSQDIIGVRYNWDGTYLDSMKFDGAGHDNDMPIDVATNTYGEMFVAGKSKNASNNFDYLVLKCVGNDKMVQTPFPFNITTFYTSANLSWQDTNTNEGGFEIERDKKACLESDSVAVWENKLIKTLPPNTTSYTDLGPDEKGLDFNYETYCYRVRAISNDSIKIPSRWLYGQITTYNPPPPSNLSAAKLNTTGIKLDWLDNSYGETRFIVKRCEGLNCAVNDSNFLEVGYPAANTQTWNDLSACEGTTYSYKISAKNDDSNTWGTNDSNTIANVSTDPMAAPAYLKATRSSEGRINLSWSDVNLDETGFKIFRCQNDSCTDFEEMTTLQPNPPGALAFYHLDNGRYSGIVNEVLDGSGNGYHATAYGGASSVPTGIKGRAVSFDGIDDYLSTNLTVDQSSAASQLTMAAWVYPASTSAGDHNLICTGNGGYDWSIIRQGGAWKVVNGTDVSDPGFTVDVNTWQHIAAVFQNGKVVFYKNGVPSPEFNTSFDTSTSTVSIGTNITQLAGFFDGKIDEVAIFSRALSLDELKVLSNNHFSGPNQALYLKMDESSWSGAPHDVLDQSANQAHAQSFNVNTSNGANTMLDASRGRVGNFNGAGSTSGGYIDLGNAATLQTTGNQTIAFWVKPDSFSVRSHPYSKCYDGEGAITIEPNGTVNYYYGTTSAQSPTYSGIFQGFTMTSTLLAGTWTHLAIVRDLTAMKLRWYKNGDMVNETNASYRAATASTLPAFIGRGYTGNYFDGALDDFMIMNYAMSENDITTLFNTNLAGANPDMARNLYLKLDSAAYSESSKEVLDSSGLGNHATAHGTVQAAPAGIKGRAALFDGIDDYLSTDLIVDQSSAASQLTMAAWVYPTSTSSGYHYVISTDHTNGGYDWSLLRVGTTWSALTGSSAAVTGFNVDLNTWQHIAVVYQNGAMVFYKNGQPSASFATTFDAAATQPLSIGSRVLSAELFDGIIDEVSIFNRALSADELKVLYTDHLADDNPQLAIQLMMDEGSWSGAANDVKDQSVNLVHGQSFNEAKIVTDASRGRVGDFDGANGYIALGNPAALQATGSQTIAFWINPDNFSNRSSPYYKAYDGEGALALETNGWVSYYYGTSGNNSGASYQGFTMNSALTAGTWTHLAIVRDLLTMKLRWYKNGVMISETAASYPAATASTLPAYIANALAGSCGYFDGKLDEFTIMNRALSGAEIANLYNPPTIYSDTNVLPDTTYRYQVSAFNNDSACRWETNHTAIATNNSTLVTPAPLSATVLSTTKVKLNWQDNFEFEDGYVLQRCDTTQVAVCDNDSDFNVSYSFGPTTTVYNDSTVSENRAYAFRVKATNTTPVSWDSPYSNTVTPTTNAKAVPFNFNVSRANEEEILLTWSTANADQDGFQVYRCQNDSCTSFTLLKTLGPGVNTYTDKHLSPNSTYRYQVRAFKNLNQENAWTTAYGAVSPGDSNTASTTISAPAQPTAKATSTNTINLVWNDPTKRETDFIIQRCPGTVAACSDNDFAQIATAGRDSTSYTDSGSAICKSSTYSYRVQAVEKGLSNGNGSCWLKKKKININNFIANYPMRLAIPYDANMQADFDDIRFYDETEQHEINYWLESKNDGSSANVWIMTGENDSIYLYYQNANAVSASDPASVAAFTNSSYYEFFDNFAGKRSSVGNANWVELDGSNSGTNNKIAQDNGLLLRNVASGWDAALISQKTFVRAAGKAISAGISTFSSTTSPSMLGWESNQTANASNNQLVHGLYFNTYNSTGRFETYEKGISTGYNFAYNQTGSYVGVEVRLTATGASYWSGGSQIATTNSYADSPLRLAFHQNNHNAKVHWVAVRVIPATEPSFSFGAATSISGCPTAHTWAGTYSPAVEVTTPSASAPTNITATPLSDSSMGVSWTPNTTDEDAFYLERCDKNYNPCPGGNDSIFSPLATIKKTSYLTSLISAEMALYFDESSWSGVSGQVIDSSGKGVNGTSYGGASTVTDEVRGQVGKFDGSNDYVLIPGNTTLQHTTDNSFTFAAWVKPAQAPAGTDSSPPGNNNTATIIGRPGYHMGLCYTPDKRFALNIYNSTPTWFGVNSTATYEPGSWHLVVGVVDNSQKKIYIYVDDVLPDQAPYTGTLRDFGTASYYVGTGYTGNSWTFYFEGLIDEARIFNKALSATEVKALFAPSTYSYTDTGLVPGSTHSYRVKASKSSGNCDWSLLSTTAAAGTTSQPPTPTNLDASRDPNNTYSKMNLTWKDNTNTNTGFVLERSQGADCSNAAAYSEIATIFGNDTTFSDTDVCPDASYCYRIKGINEVFPIGSGLSNNGGNTPWSRRRDLSISNFQANFQTKLEIPWDSDMQENFADIRFYDATASQELSYWVETQTNGVSATVWLKTGANNNIKLYYGNPNAANSSNGNNTFTFFDDFNDGILDPVKWPTQSINWVGTYIFETAGEFKQTRYFDGYYYIQSPAFAGTATATQGFVLTARTKSNTVAPDGWSPVMWYKSGSEGDSILDYSLGRQVLRERGSWAYWSAQNLPLNLWHQNSIILKSTTAMTAKAEYETAPSRNWSYDSATTTANANYYIRMGSRHDGYGIGWEYLDGRVDWVFMRKWAAVEPVVILASEERGAFVWETAYTTPVNQTLSTPAPPSSVSATSVSETAINLSWTDNLNNEDGYLIERCQGSNCNDFNMISKVDKNFRDDFSSGILPQYWNLSGWLQYSSDSVAPIDFSDDSGAAKISSNNGRVVLHTQSNKTGNVNHSASRMTLKDPSFLGNADFDIQVDYYLPNPVLAYTQYPVYARLQAGFSSGDYIYVERCNTNQLAGVANIGGVGQGGSFYSDFVASAGKLRLTRVGNVLSSYAWNNDQWTLLNTHSSALAAGATVSYVIITQYANRNEQFGAGGEDLTTELDNFVIIKSNGVFNFLDTGAMVPQPYNTIEQPSNWTLTGQLDSGNDTVAPIHFSDASGSADIDLSTGAASLHTTTTGTGSPENYNRSSLNLDTNGEVVFGNDDFDLQLKFNITGNSCSKGAKGLAAYLKLEENSWNGTADEVLDYSGTGRNGTSYGGASIVNDSSRGKVGYFDGVDDKVLSQVLTNNKIISMAGEHTLSIWFKAPYSGAGGWTWPLAFADANYSGNTTAIRYDTAATPPYNGRLTAWTANDSNGVRVGVPYTSAIYNDSLWHHIAYTYSAANGGNIYIDGSLIATDSVNPITNIRDGQTFLVGGYTSHQFNGWLDEARIFTKELSAGEVQLLANDSFHDGGLAPVGIRIGFDNGDYLTLERSGGANGEYDATGMINSALESKKQLTSASTGKLRIQRTDNAISASFWDGSAWTTLQTHPQNLPAGARVNSVQIYNQAAGDSVCDLSTTVSGVSMTASDSTHYYFDNESLITGRPYTYRVSPYKEGGDCTNWSAYSGSSSATPTVIAPTGLSTTGVTTTEVHLTWADLASSETNYEIQRCTGSACTFAADDDTKTWTVAANVYTYSDMTPVNTTAYRYRVRAINSSVGWDSAYSSVLPVTTLTPQAPSNLAVTWGSEIRLNLTWNDNTSDETSFMVERGNESCGPSSFNVIKTLAAGATSYRDNDSGVGLNFNTTYCYRVRAFKNTGLANSWYSNYSNTFSKKTQVESLTLVATPSSVNTNLISLSWSDKSESETGFTIKRCQDSNCTNFSAGKNATSYQDNTVCDSSTYTYQVRPIKMDISNTVNLWDDAVQMSPTVPATTRTPEAPFDFTVTEIHNDSTEFKQMLLYWEYNDSDETGFTIQRCSGINCNNFSTISSQSAIVSNSTFNTPINSQASSDYWKIGGKIWYLDAYGALNSTTDWSSRPINLSNEQNAAMVTGTGNGKVELYSQMLYKTGWSDSGQYIQALMKMRDPAILGSGDFDLRVSFNLPDGLISNNKNHSYLKMEMSFPDGDGDQRLNPDTVSIEYKIRSDGTNRYNSYCRINNIIQNDSSAPTFDTMGKLRIMRDNGFISTYYWNSSTSQWVQLMRHGTAMTFNLAPDTVQLYNQVQFILTSNVTIRTEIEDFKIFRSSFSYTDKNLPPSSTYRYRVVPTKTTPAGGCAWGASDPRHPSLYSPEESERTRPMAPTGLTATTIKNNTIKLEWTDNDADEDGYEIERLTWNGHYLSIYSSYDRDTIFTNNSRSFITSAGNEPGKTYTYRVRAYRGADKSAYSLPASALTEPYTNQADYDSCPE